MFKQKHVLQDISDGGGYSGGGYTSKARELEIATDENVRLIKENAALKKELAILKGKIKEKVYI